jgi:hypothetical protein
MKRTMSGVRLPQLNKFCARDRARSAAVRGTTPRNQASLIGIAALFAPDPEMTEAEKNSFLQKGDSFDTASGRHSRRRFRRTLCGAHLSWRSR